MADMPARAQSTRRSRSPRGAHRRGRAPRQDHVNSPDAAAVAVHAEADPDVPGRKDDDRSQERDRQERPDKDRRRRSPARAFSAPPGRRGRNPLTLKSKADTEYGRKRDPDEENVRLRREVEDLRRQVSKHDFQEYQVSTNMVEGIVKR